MASLTQESSGSWRIEFRRDGKRHFLRIGSMPRKSADLIKTRVESLLSHALSSIPLAPDVAAWVGSVGDGLASKLAAVGLLPKREKARDYTVKEWVERYIDGKAGAADNSLKNYRQAAQKLYDGFGPDRPITDVTPERAERWADGLRKDYAPAYAARLVKFARTFFKSAPLPANPFAGVRAGSMANASLLRFVTREEIDRVLAACPDVRWRLIVALARFAGLRCPSEVRALTWPDIDWPRGRFLVRSPKTKQDRWVPTFPEVREPLEEHRRDAAPDSVRVVEFDHLRTHFVRIVERAGLTPWPRLFQNLRASRETELLATYPQHVVTAWIGHTAAVGAKHYWSVTEDHFVQASGGKSGGTVAGNPAGTGVDIRGHSRTFAEGSLPESPEKVDICRGIEQITDPNPVHPTGGPPKRNSSRIRRFFRKPAGFPAGNDPHLARVVAAWPTLTDGQRRAILSVITKRPAAV